MKKSLTVAAISGLCFATLGQGVVNWSSPAGGFIVQTNGLELSPLVFGSPLPGWGTQGNTDPANTYYYELLVGSAASAPTSLAALSSWSDTGLEARNHPTASGRITMINSSAAATATNLPVGVTLNDILVGWSANLGTTWSAALANLNQYGGPAGVLSYFGVSSMGSITGVAAPGPGFDPFGAAAGQILQDASNPMQLYVIPTPEPGTAVLTALGGAGLLLFHRKWKGQS